MKLSDEELLTAETYTQAAVTWTADHVNDAYWKNSVRKLKEFLPKGHILDIGTGGGRDAKNLIDEGFKVTGIDTSMEMLAVAKETAPDMEVVHKSVYDLDFEKKFDGFWCGQMLLHIPKKNLRFALQKIASQLKPNAYGFISVKQGEGEKTIKDKYGKRFYSFFSDNEFRYFLSEANFIVEYDNTKKADGDSWLMYHVRLDS